MGIEEIQRLTKEELNHIDQSFDPELLDVYGKDSYNLYSPKASVILFPSNINEVSDIIKFANKHLIPIVPSGGRTGLCGGATAVNDELVLSLEKLVKPILFNPEEATVEVSAGTITEEIQLFAESKNLLFPIDFVSTGSSNIGGNIATNAGGTKVIRYGQIRNWVTGLKVVTGEGEILNLNKGLTKNATGYDFRHLFIGSEGTLGVIVEATIQLTKLPQNVSTIFLAFEDLDKVISILEFLKKEVDLIAFEFFTDESLLLALNEGRFPFSFETHYPFYIIAEYDNLNGLDQQFSGDRRDEILIEKVLKTNLISDGKIAVTEKDRLLFWKHRHLIPAAINKFHPYKNDISIRIRHIPAFIKELDELLRLNYEDLKVLWFGHIGDGNLHVNIIKPDNYSMDEFRNKCDEVSVKLYQTIEKFKGSISAEHGVGLSKKEFLHYSRSSVEINYMKEIKRIFDPNHILNPNKIF